MNLLTDVSGPPLTAEAAPRWIFDRLEEWVRRDPHRPAFVVDHNDRVEEYLYEDVLKFAERTASALHIEGIVRGERVGILMENVPQWVFTLLGAMRLGAVTVPLATTLPEKALCNVAEHAGCRIVVADPPNAEKAGHIAAAIGAKMVMFEGLVSAGLNPEPAPHPDCDGDETAILIYTSGTTGDPKGVQLSLNNLNYEIRGVMEAIEMSPNHRILSVLPFSHVLPLVANSLGPLCVGAAVVFLSSISPQRIIEVFHKHRITCFICVPQFFYVLHKRIFSEIQHQGALTRNLFRFMFAVAAHIHSPGLRRRLFARIHRSVGPDLWLFASGGSRFDPRVAADLSVLGYTVLQAYGLTETAAAATATLIRDNAIGSVGKPIRGVSLHIDSPNPQGVGEVWIRGPIVMKGYFRDPGKTQAAMSDGWLRSGDLGYIRRDGNLVITGRSKDVIVLPNGENIYPEELEMHYGQTPLIKEICILGLPEAGGPGGEKLHAVVVPDIDEFRRRGQTSILEAVRFALENLSQQLPSYQRILSHSIRNEPLPRTATRKLKRYEIQAEEAARRQTLETRAPEGGLQDHEQFRQGVGALIARSIREAKPDAGAMGPSTNIELDLGFDSLARVELFGLLEAKIGTHIDEQEASRIFTLGDLLEALGRSRDAASLRKRNWADILNVSPSDELNRHPVFKRWAVTSLAAYLTIKAFKALCLVFLRLEYHGLEKLPATGPYLLCPNHESFLDGPVLVSTLSRSVIDRIFILGYSDYWEGGVSRFVAKCCNIVSIDPNVNLIRAMQVGAVGLRRNRVLLMFPEGTRSIDGRLGEFKKGAAILAFELGVPIVPVGLRGGFEAWPRGQGFKLHRVAVHFGDPIDPGAFRGLPDPYTALTEVLRNDVKILSDDV